MKHRSAKKLDGRSFRFEDVGAAIRKHWGLALTRGSAKGNVEGKDGRWDTSQSKTGFVVSGNFPGHGYQIRRYRSLARIIERFELGPVLGAAK